MEATTADEPVCTPISSTPEGVDYNEMPRIDLLQIAKNRGITLQIAKNRGITVDNYVMDTRGHTRKDIEKARDSLTSKAALVQLLRLADIQEAAKVPSSDSLEEGQWACNFCTGRNEALYILCHICETPRHSDPNQWACQKCTLWNAGTQTECTVCGTGSAGNAQADTPVTRKRAEPNGEVERKAKKRALNPSPTRLANPDESTQGSTVNLSPTEPTGRLSLQNLASGDPDLDVTSGDDDLTNMTTLETNWTAWTAVKEAPHNTGLIEHWKTTLSGVSTEETHQFRDICEQRVFEQSLQAAQRQTDLVAAVRSFSDRESRIFPIPITNRLGTEDQSGSTPPTWKPPQCVKLDCRTPHSTKEVILHECRFRLDNTQHRCPLKESNPDASHHDTKVPCRNPESDEECDCDRCTWAECEHTYCCCCITEMNPTICRTHRKPMSECGCRVMNTTTAYPDTGVCCYCTYHGWIQCEEGCKEMHPFGSGRWQHVLELNAQVTIRQCNDDAQFLKAFKRHKVEEQQRVQRQLGGDQETRDSDDEPSACVVNAEEDDESSMTEVGALRSKVVRLRAEVAESNNTRLRAELALSKNEIDQLEKKVERLEERCEELTEEMEKHLEGDKKRQKTDSDDEDVELLGPPHATFHSDGDAIQEHMWKKDKDWDTSDED